MSKYKYNNPRIAKRRHYGRSGQADAMKQAAKRAAEMETDTQVIQAVKEGLELLNHHGSIFTAGTGYHFIRLRSGDVPDEIRQTIMGPLTTAFARIRQMNYKTSAKATIRDLETSAYTVELREFETLCVHYGVEMKDEIKTALEQLSPPSGQQR